MKIECMCVVCHGPVELKYRNKVTAAVCSSECNYYWHHSMKPHGKLSWRYENLRLVYAFRREQEALVLRLKRVTRTQRRRVSA